MEPIEGSETSAFKPQTPGNFPKENILHSLTNLLIFFLRLRIHVTYLCVTVSFEISSPCNCDYFVLVFAVSPMMAIYQPKHVAVLVLLKMFVFKLNILYL